MLPNKAKQAGTSGDYFEDLAEKTAGKLVQLETIKISLFHDGKMKYPILGFQVEAERVFMPQRHVAGFTFSTEGAGSFDGKDNSRTFI